MNATLQTRGISDAHNPAVRGARPSGRTRIEHCTGARRVSGGSRTGELYGIGRAGSAAETTQTLTLHGILPVRGEGQDLPGGPGNGPQAVGSGEPAVGSVAGATLFRLAPVEDGSRQGGQGGVQGEPSAAADEHLAEFTAYVRERRASLYATAYHLTGDRFEAEDLLQSALFSTYRAWGRITDKAAVGGYLRRTMTNLHISAWRRRKLNEYPTEELPETVGDTDAMGGTELRAVLWQALAKLPENQRTMLVLRYYEGRTDPEIADILNISVGTVKSSIWRSLRRLRDDEQLNRTGDSAFAFGELVA
ncbi:RNA polymerase sigma-70 factor (sigma-E family) [Kitasatospora sp. MAA4]|uniref:SigE family RNA polymerase sigma factor n=1 Tax=Kitasatospora sp. MAA4 TaxID=3035093 RepID=UPI00247475EA|nr:SigE family RNA polymerase sigma factor [Kitasatospora sp. MAA4]MDH6136004.1 RNA polymerase sigma-70 factor (sigma-E family) [Kitasatospora sp. MAA4]